MQQAEFEALLGRFSAAIEREGGAALGAVFTPDGVYTDVFYGAFRGRAAIARMVDEHFWGHGENYRWEMREPVVSGDIGYARWTFSFDSRLEEARGKRVLWEGMSRFRLSGGLIADYAEMFDIAIALGQSNFAPERVARVAGKHIARLRERHAGSAHLPARPGSR